MTRPKSRLALGMRPKKITGKYPQKTIQLQRAWIRTDDEVFNRIEISASVSTRPYTTKAPVTGDIFFCKL